MAPPGKHHLNFEIDADLHGELRQIAHANERTVSQEIRLLIRRYVTTIRNRAPGPK